ncbi:MAG: HesA/MoeB/ThiF family protein [Thermoguttaceae bacterium]
MAAGDLTPEEWERYARQLGPGVLSREGQVRLNNSAALVTRVGGMGGPASLCLAMAGIGRLVIAHGGTLISPDLNRQVLGREAFVGRPRAAHFADQLRSINRFVEVEAIDHEPSDREAAELARRVDVILSCPPGFQERMRLNRAAVESGTPLVDAAQWGMSGTLIVVDPGRTACLECLYPEPPPFEELFPVIGGISSALGSLAALEAIKILSGVGQPMYGRMWIVDSFAATSSMVQLQRRPDCPCCTRTTSPEARR